MRRIPVAVGALLVLLLGCASPTQDVPVESIRLQSSQGREVFLRVEMARTGEEQRRGLMGRTALGADEGMLFVFPDSAVRSFWMKNTLIPLDILFFDEAGTFVSSATMAPCPIEEEACPSTLSRGPARFALEVPEGFLARTGVDSRWTLALGGWASP